MTTADQLLAPDLATFQRFGDRFVKALTALDESLWFAQPHGQVNHPAWTVGHLCVTTGRCIDMLGGIAPPTEGNWRQWFGNGSTPAPGSGRDPCNADFPSPATLLKLYQTIHTGVLECAATCPASRLDEPNPIEPLRGFQPMVGGVIRFMIGPHECYHIAQFFCWKKALEASR